MPERSLPRHLALSSVALMALALVAFWPLYLSKPLRDVDAYTHAHAALGTLWLLMLLTQSLLAAWRRRHLHRLVGRLSWLLAPAFVVSGLLLAHFRVSRMPADVFAREAFTLYLPIFVAVLFTWAYGSALRWRSAWQVHARFMAATAALLIDPVVGRILFFHFPRLPADWLYQGITFTLVGVWLLAMLRSLPATVPGRASYRNFVTGTVVAQILWFALPHTGPWRSFATWFRELPLT